MTLTCHRELSCTACFFFLFPACIHGAIRLSGGSSSTEGRVEVCTNDKWNALCYGRFWDDNAASVTCTQLGLSSRGIKLQGERERETPDTSNAMESCTGV